MDLYTSIRDILIVEEVPLISSKRYKKDVVELLCKGYREAGWSSRSSTDFLNKWFPDRKPNVKIHKWLLAEYGLKLCPRCLQVHSLEDFSNNSAQPDGKQTYCKVCQYEVELPTSAEKAATYRARKLKATPVWADRGKIRKIYETCPEGWHVDHIIPLQGENVCGLHVHENLQHLPARDNMSKGNKLLE